MTTTKKLVERIYLDEARRASSVFPDSEPTEHDPLDFLLEHPSGILGIEITELCRENDRKEGARLGYVAPKARRLYAKRTEAQPVSVSPVFSHDAHRLGVDVLASGLADFVYAHRANLGTYTWYDAALPEGYSHIGIFETLEGENEGDWRYFRAFDVPLATHELVAARIAEKNARIREYRKVASHVWLLIVNDLFLGPGEVHARTEDLAEWTFEFEFDKVLLFSRQPGGSGDVVELNRN